MNADKELNKIKQHIHILCDGYEPGTIGQESGGIIIAAAECLYTEIGQLSYSNETIYERLGGASGRRTRIG